MFVLISLMSIVFVFSCNSKKQQEETAAPVKEVTDVTFSNPSISIADNWIKVTIDVSSSRGKETLSKSFPILYEAETGNRYFTDNVKIRISGTEQKIVRTSTKDIDNFFFDVEENQIVVETELPDTSISNKIFIFLPNNISIKKYGKTYKFERINYSSSVVSNNLQQEDMGLYRHVMLVHIEYDKYDYGYNIGLTNVISSNK